MKIRVIYLLLILMVITRCGKKNTPETSAHHVQTIEVFLNPEIELTSLTDNKNQAKEKTATLALVNVQDSRCPANAVCIQAGAAVATFEVSTPPTEKKKLKIYIGNYRGVTNQDNIVIAADSVPLELNKQEYQLILKSVTPYPGTSETEKTKATLLLRKK